MKASQLTGAQTEAIELALTALRAMLDPWTASEAYDRIDEDGPNAVATLTALLSQSSIAEPVAA